MALAYSSPDDSDGLTAYGVVQNYEQNKPATVGTAKNGTGPYATQTSKDPETFTATLHHDGSGTPTHGGTITVNDGTFHLTNIRKSNGVDEWNGLEVEGTRQYSGGVAI